MEQELTVQQQHIPIKHSKWQYPIEKKTLESVCVGGKIVTYLWKKDKENEKL